MKRVLSREKTQKAQKKNDIMHLCDKGDLPSPFLRLLRLFAATNSPVRTNKGKTP